MKVTVNLNELTQYDIDVELMQCIEKEIARLVHAAIRQSVMKIVADETTKEIDTLINIDLFKKVRVAIADPEFQNRMGKLSRAMLIEVMLKKLYDDAQLKMKEIKSNAMNADYGK